MRSRGLIRTVYSAAAFVFRSRLFSIADPCHYLLYPSSSTIHLTRSRQSRLLHSTAYCFWNLLDQSLSIFWRKRRSTIFFSHNRRLCSSTGHPKSAFYPSCYLHLERQRPSASTSLHRDQLVRLVTCVNKSCEPASLCERNANQQYHLSHAATCQPTWATIPLLKAYYVSQQPVRIRRVIRPRSPLSNLG